jgi:hypothetical protein
LYVADIYHLLVEEFLEYEAVYAVERTVADPKDFLDDYVLPDIPELLIAAERHEPPHDEKSIRGLRVLSRRILTSDTTTFQMLMYRWLTISAPFFLDLTLLIDVS